MNIIQKLDDWYKEWYGESHLHTSNRIVHDSAEAQDFARYCIEQFNNGNTEKRGANCECKEPKFSISGSHWICLKCGLPPH